MNEFPRVPWKGQTFTQIVSSIKQNSDDGTAIGLSMKSRPIKHHRRELIVNTSRNGSTTINELGIPGGTVVNSSSSRISNNCGNGLIDINLTTNQSEHPCNNTLNHSNNNDNVVTNALNRIRTSGLVNKNYQSSYNQYLTSRVKKFDQNQYNYLKEGNKHAIPGQGNAMNNIYAFGAVKGHYVPIYYKPNNSTYAVQGAVSQGDKIARLKYNTITTNGHSFLTAYGSQVASANAYAYSVSNNKNPMKDKKFPDTKTPIINSITGELTCC